MYIPKKIKWNSLTEFKDFLLRETTEKIVLFEGWRLVTETTEYGIIDGILKFKPKEKKVKLETKLDTLGSRPKPITKKKKIAEAKPKTKKEILEEMRQRGRAALDKKKKNKR